MEIVQPDEAQEEVEKLKADFVLKEFECLRKEIEYRTLSQFNTERNVVVGVSIVFGALATLRPDAITEPELAPLKVYFWFLPALIVVAGAARFWDDHNAILSIGRYIARRERGVDPVNMGWENSAVACTRFG